MPADRVLVIDAGTSALRAVMVGASDGSVGPLATEPWPVFIPDDTGPYGREFEAGGVFTALQRLLAAAAPHRDALAAVAFTGQREGLVFLDQRRQPLLISPNVDARASAEGIAIDASHAPAVYAATGHLPSLIQAPAKLAWFRANRPDDAARVREVLPLADWLASILTGSGAMTRSLAVENGLLDVTMLTPPAALLDALQVPPSLLPPAVVDGFVVVEPAGGDGIALPVVLAGADTQCALLGMGAFAPGDAGVAAGWSAPVQLVTANATLDPLMRTWAGVHVVPDCWVIESNAGETGRAWDWACGLLAQTPNAADALATTSPPGARDAMAVLGAPTMNAAAMRAGVGGLTFPLPLVMSAPGAADLLRSVLEATAFAIRANIEQLQAVSGVAMPVIRLGGGMSRSALFAQMLADVLDRRVEVAAAETSAVGAAVLAAKGIGLHATLENALDAMTAGRRCLEPDPRTSAVYDDVYARWREMAGRMEQMP